MKKFVSTLLVMLLLISSVPMMASAANQKEKESNDSFSTANSISINTTIRGNLSLYSDVDYYKFTIPDTGYVNIDFNHDYVDDAYNEYWYIGLFDSSNKNMMGRNSYGNITNNPTPNIGLPAGTYYIKICHAFKYSELNYSFKINYTKSSAWEKEFNDTFSTANSVPINSTICGSLMEYSDDDYYKFSLPNDGYIKIDFNHEFYDDAYNEYWYIGLFDSSNKNMMGRNSYGNITNNPIPNIGLPAGTYYIKICHAFKHSDLNYNFKINYIESSSWETEFNDSLTTADPISVNSTTFGSIMSSSDSDYYKFILSSNDNIKILFNHEDVGDAYNDYWYLRLYDSANEKIYQKSYYGDKIINESEKISLSSGTYYIRVSTGFKYSDLDYNFKIKSSKQQTEQFVVTYNANGGSVSPSSAKVTAGGSVTLPTPTKTGCTCLGWSASSSATTASYSCGTSYKPTQNITLYAVWKKNAPTMCTLTYNANGGSVSPSSATFEMGKTVTLPTPTRSGYTCLGWSTNKSATSAEYECGKSYTILGSATLYAVWQKNSTDKAQVYGVTLQDSISVDYKGTAKIIPTIDKDRNAKYSVKWESSNSSVVSVDNDGNIHGLKKGNAKVTCTVTDSYGNTYSDSCNVNVKYSGVQWVIIIVLFGWIWYI